MSNQNTPGELKLTLPERLSSIENLMSNVLDESEQLKFQREKVENYIDMLEIELKAARRMLQSIDEAIQMKRAKVEERAKVEVILKIFSGREDPSWVMSKREVEELRRLLDRGGLKKILKETKEPPGLGYSGFTILNETGLKGIPERIDVYRGMIIIFGTEKEQKKQTYYEDANRIELWLVEQAASHDYSGIIERFGGPSLK
jgi:hypothetical protein